MLILLELLDKQKLETFRIVACDVCMCALVNLALIKVGHEKISVASDHCVELNKSKILNKSQRQLQRFASTNLKYMIIVRNCV